MIHRKRFENEEYVTTLINAFVSHILQNIETSDELSLAVKKVINEITENFSDCNINLGQFLKQSGYAEDYIRSQFKKMTGKTPTKFLNEIRVSHACFLADIYKNALSLNAIAEKCGYTDNLYFSRCFKKIKGMSPREYVNNL